MMLFIMRHGTAEAAPPGGEDAARKLTPDGRDRIRQAALGLRALGIDFDLILTSSAARAAETAELVASAVGGTIAPEALAELAADGAPAAIAAALKHFTRRENVLVVGHEPALSGLASLLLAGSPEAMRIRLKQGGCLALELPGRPGRGGAELRWLLTQRQLRKLRK